MKKIHRYCTTCFLMVFWQSMYAQEIPQLQFMEENLETLIVESGEITFLDVGEGEPILAFHPGIGYLWWQFFIQDASENYRVISPDPYNFDIDNFHDLWEALELEPAHIVSHSIGGWIAINLADTYPEMARSLVLLEPGYSPSAEALEASNELRVSMDPPTCTLSDVSEALRNTCLFVNGMSGNGYFEGVSDNMRSLILSQDLNIARTLAESGPPSPPSVDLPDGWVFPFSPICETEGTLSLPILFIRGEKSIDQINLDAHESCLSQHVSAVISNAGHNAHMDNPEEFNEVVNDFISEIE